MEFSIYHNHFQLKFSIFLVSYIINVLRIEENKQKTKVLKVKKERELKRQKQLKTRKKKKTREELHNCVSSKK